MIRPFALRQKAREDVKKIWEWAADRYGEPQADRLVASLYDDCLMLARMRRIGHKRADLTRRHSLFWTSGSYYIIYAPETAPLEVERIIYGGRDLEKELA